MSLQRSLLSCEVMTDVPSDSSPSRTYMAKWSRRRARTALAAAVLLLLVCVLYAAYKAVELLARALTVPGAVIVALCALLLLLRIALETLVFPGSLSLWRRSIESHFCQEMATQVLLRVKDLRHALEIIAEISTERPKNRPIPRSLASTVFAKKTISNLLGTFADMRADGVILNAQRRLLELLEALRKALSDTSVKRQGTDVPVTLWDWMDSFSSDTVAVSAPEDVPYLTSALETCRRLEALLFQSCGRVSCYSRCKRWLFDSTLGHINQMRHELISRFHAEQIWVETADGCKIDCVWVPAADRDAPTMLFCNPNGGFYEFSCYQSEWLEFYNRAGVNVLLWNYRGYGRTKGRPTPTLLKRDGVAVAEYLRSTRRVGVLGVHGESMGGMVAAHIARTVGVDLLVADRTFSSLEAVARFSFGAAAHRVFQTITWWNTDTVEDYLHASCYKLVCADPNDSMIADFASLKCGIATNLLSAHYYRLRSPVQTRTYWHILSQQETDELREALCKFVKIVLYFNKRDGERSPRSVGTMIQGLSQISGQSNYQMLGPDTDAVLEDESLLATIYRLYILVDNFNAGGKPLTSVPTHSDSIRHVQASAEALQMWLAVLDVWGSYSKEGEAVSTRLCAAARVRDTITGINAICNEHRLISNPLLVQLFAQAETIARLLEKVSLYLEETTPESPGRKSGSSGSTLAEKPTSKTAPDWTRAGFLLPVSCGHSGLLSSQEKQLFESHLLRAQFLRRVED